MKKIIVSIASVAALATAGMAAAATNSMPAAQPQQASSFFHNSASGIYVNGGLGWGHVSGSALSNVNITSKNDLAWNAALGYQFNPYFALETSYIDFGRVKSTYQNQNITEKLHGFGIDAKGIYPVNQKINVFGTAGMMDMTDQASGAASGKNRAWTPTLGAGASYAVTKSIAVTGQDVYAFKKSGYTPAANALLAGVSYKFNI